MRSILLGTAGLGVAAAFALWLTVARGGVTGTQAQVRSAVRIAAAVIMVQTLHFVEELFTGFHRQFPELLGLSPWRASFFVGFNLAWVAVWALSCWGLAVRRHAALFPLWFLGLAALANGVAHPVLSVRGGAYFPGVLTAPFVGIAGLILVRRLVQLTAARGAAPGAV